MIQRLFLPLPLPLLLLLGVTGLCAIVLPSEAEVYRWQDEQGKTVFGDTPPRNNPSTRIQLNNTQNTGTQFANPAQITNFERSPSASRPKRSPHRATISTECRGYIAQLNKVEIFLEHSISPRDQQKAGDLRKLIQKQCGPINLKQKFSDSRCRRYQRDLNKLEIFMEHTHTLRDEQKADDLRQQLRQECR
jgi:Domain of unknown function (DUF4124)